ncbi:MAG: glutamate--cysteine ligase [Gammaproteobacteria bacterium]|nr:glutamate--cysteine ligase [Gammaproteobacteria bacterium]MBU1776395.1 glutamate--cysteine ligase [Gammaproteobacteria bacterium]MBU1968092.1 glutamate--cysteine ligase [Gammaproteobacteria bacterium]
MVPRLTTALKGPLLDLEQRILTAQPQIEHWFRTQWQERTPPFYSSVDLRNSGFKLAPVDTNLFPGGFNNLNPEFVPLCVHAVQSTIEKICPEARGLLLIPENHTRNQFYLQNVAQLALILRQAGLNVRIGSLLPEITQPTTLQLANGNSLTLEPLVRSGNRLGVADFDPCMVLLNNDLSAGVPDIVKGLEQTVLPPLEAGWYQRRKSQHFRAYDKVADDFAKLLDIDPWLINPYFAVCDKVDFHARTGEDCLVAQVDLVLERIADKYEQYGVKDDPFVIVKADAGTYGMGIMTVKDGREVRDLNRKQRNKMAVVKEGLQVSDVLVQEGVYTFEDLNGAIAEPVVYMIDRYVVGGFYRVHTERGVDENLNAPGMRFEPLAFESCCAFPNPACAPDDTPNRFYAYGVVGRLAMLAAAIEIEEMQQ